MKNSLPLISLCSILLLCILCQSCGVLEKRRYSNGANLNIEFWGRGKHQTPAPLLAKSKPLHSAVKISEINVPNHPFTNLAEDDSARTEKQGQKKDIFSNLFSAPVPFFPQDIRPALKKKTIKANHSLQIEAAPPQKKTFTIQSPIYTFANINLNAIYSVLLMFSALVALVLAIGYSSLLLASAVLVLMSIERSIKGLQEIKEGIGRGKAFIYVSWIYDAIIIFFLFLLLFAVA